jgi:two-component system sensor histidine kinase KdpD
MSRGVNENFQTLQIQDSGKVKQRLLVSVSPGQNSEQLVRRAYQLAHALNCWWGAVYVEISPALSVRDQLQMSRTLTLARSLGAEVITMTDPDMVRGLLCTAMQNRVTQIIIEKKVWTSHRKIFRNDRSLKRLLRESGEIDIHTVVFKE